MAKSLTKTGGAAEGFIDHAEIAAWLEAPPAGRTRAADIIAKAREARGLEPEEVAALVTSRDPGLWDEVFAAARGIKETIYGRRLVLFAPLYISNWCVNNCRYCGYRAVNASFRRRRLTLEEIAGEVRVLEAMGHKRLALEAGESPVHCPIDYVVDAIRTIYETSSRDGRGSIRRVNVNIAATTVSDYRRLDEAGIGTYILFQETYHRPTYAAMHPAGPKSDYLWHLYAMDRAMEGGIDDVGIGALFGLYDWRFEVLALLLHARHLEEVWGVGPHTISVPRLRPADGVSLADFPHLVSDEDFRRLVAVLRLAVPYTGMILTAREPAAVRHELMAFGVSQIDAGSRVELGGYTEAGDSQQQIREREQFELGDIRPLDEVISQLLADEYIPSFCTACYRLGRTGEQFMEFAIPGFIEQFCTPNALTTLQEYLVDYASPATRELGMRLIRQEIGKMPESPDKQSLLNRLERIEKSDERDLYF